MKSDYYLETLQNKIRSQRPIAIVDASKFPNLTRPPTYNSRNDQLMIRKTPTKT